MSKVRQCKTAWETSIRNGDLYFEDARQCHIDDAAFAEIIGDGHTRTIRLISLDSTWVERVWIDGVGMRSDSVDTEMTLRREIKSGRGYWYAYRKALGKQHKRYVGTDEQVTQEKLLEVARKMPTSRMHLTER